MPPVSVSAEFEFAQAVTQWQAVHGRQGLPWQGTTDPYRVWLSEIMLQQTQVVTVLGYFPRFLAKFPSVRELAAADQAEVLALWSGLGYYSRARNMHRCAQVIVSEHQGQFPRSATVLQTLPGIGPSTAAAIASFCFGEAVSIFDGNVKRVLARFLGFEGDLSSSVANNQLRELAHSLVPKTRLHVEMPRYTQGLMDLGAMVCTRTKPRCGVCPLQRACAVQASADPARLPVKSRRTARRTLAWHVLVLRQPSGQVWLVQRPDRGIWASLYSPPVFETEAEMRASGWMRGATDIQALEPFTHSLTHRELVLHPVVCRVPLATPDRAGWDTASGLWVAPTSVQHLGLPAPIARLLEQVEQLS
jgi:A/G-specific adenine glycosylase